MVFNILMFVLIVFFPVFNSAVLEPDFHLIFSQIQGGGQVLSFGTNYILLSLEFFLQYFQLLWGENCSCPFSLAITSCIVNCKKNIFEFKF